MKKLARAKFDASFTVEASLVMTIIFLSMATVIVYAYAKRDSLVSSFTLQESALDASRIEDGWLQKLDSLEDIETYVNNKLHKVARLQGRSIDAQSESGRGVAVMNTNRSVSLPAYDPEKNMRTLAPVSKILEKE